MSTNELSDMHRRINNAFNKMRFSSTAKLSAITKDDTDETAFAKIAGNIERMSIIIEEFSDKAQSNERTLTCHNGMFRALGELMSEVEAVRKAS